MQFFIELVNVLSRSDLIPEELEAICIEVRQAKSKPILIASVYRPPISALVDVFDKIEILMQYLDQEHKQIIILGDSNCDLLSLTIVNHHTRKFLDLTEVFQFDQVTTQPTRITQNFEASIEVALSNCPEMVSNSGVLHVGVTDHSLIHIKRKISFDVAQTKIIESRNYRNYNSGLFNENLDNLLKEYA